ncbi:MAG: hypothetical protein COW00_09670 [Bdellovibrio sp. CG12_big_fil_rev_8_21_14_0_65_39_13]|nr:MAG: hypothetical protein COW78_16025 [Bdellovibrio sp. CG22_combo_CG10-13_8_21_14_all_39_27]PIQ59567.1 MAG: hypothetical protein COW00_09670 [Bdellovibrio sp. CG12_big_fil_rev_8_21_14_0_65_39_13]PIR33197.1 MAG: hypothetical protein COV37_17275 [Bdellovibrio sp. CG11_big_fil_rev_8_21_14_0_20_39_38]
MKKSAAAALLILLSLNSCKTDRVMDSTLKMGETTNQMKEGMDQTNITMNQMANNTDNMYHQIRTKEAQETRDRAFEALDKETVFEDKLTEAAAYHQGFEYQLWTNHSTAQDTTEFREDLMETAVDEYFRALQRFMDEAKDPSDLSPTNEDNYAQNLMVMAVTMHESHHAQDLVIKNDPKVEKVTMLSMVKESLRLQKKINAGEMKRSDLKAYQNALLFWHDEAVNMLRYRYNILMTMTLVKVSDVKKKPSFGLFGLAGLYIKAKTVYFNWDSKYASLTESRQAKINDFVDEAIKTRDFLKEIGVEVKLDSKVAKALGHMQMPACTDCRRGQANNQEQFKKLVEEVLHPAK